MPVKTDGEAFGPVRRTARAMLEEILVYAEGMERVRTFDALAWAVWLDGSAGAEQAAKTGRLHCWTKRNSRHRRSRTSYCRGISALQDKRPSNGRCMMFWKRNSGPPC